MWKQFRQGYTLSLSCSQSPFWSLWVPAQIRCQCLSVFTQKSFHSDSSSPQESECHNRRKLPPLSHKRDALLQEVQVRIGNSSLCDSVKVLVPCTAAVCSSESERSSGRCPLLLSHQETPSQSRSPRQEASVTTLSSEVVFWIVSWGKPGGRWSQSLPGHCQSGLMWLRVIVLRQHKPPNGSPDHRASSVLWGSPAGIEPQRTVLSSNNAN